MGFWGSSEAHKSAHKLRTPRPPAGEPVSCPSELRGLPTMEYTQALACLGLGAGEAASDRGALRAAYRRAALRHHPDKVLPLGTFSRAMQTAALRGVLMVPSSVGAAETWGRLLSLNH